MMTMNPIKTMALGVGVLPFHRLLEGTHDRAPNSPPVYVHPTSSRSLVAKRSGLIVAFALPTTLASPRNEVSDEEYEAQEIH